MEEYDIIATVNILELKYIIDCEYYNFSHNKIVLLLVQCYIFLSDIFCCIFVRSIVMFDCPSIL